MTVSFRRVDHEPAPGRRLVVAVLAGLVLVFVFPLGAQDPPEEPSSLAGAETQQTASMREWVYKELSRAQGAAEENNYSEAIRYLDKLSAKDINSYEQTQVLNLYAFIYYSQENYPKAIETFEKLLRTDNLNAAIENSTIFSLGQLYFATENYSKAADMLNRWFVDAKDPKPQQYEMLGQAYYQMKEYRKAIAPMRKSIELTRASGGKVREQSYLLLRVAYYELKEYDQVITMLQELVRRYPGKKYWMQLVSVYGEKGDERRQLNTLELAYLQGFLTKESEVLSLVGLLLGNDLPYRAGKILEKEIETGVVKSTLRNWRMLSQAWTLAQEDSKAIPALTRAAGMSKDGEIDVILANAYSNLDRWEEAAAAARTALRKGSLARPDQAYVLLGQILFNMDLLTEARSAFQSAQSDNRSRRLASQWISYIDSEVERKQQLAQALTE